MQIDPAAALEARRSIGCTPSFNYAGLGDRSDSDRPAVHARRRSRGRRRSARRRWRSAASRACCSRSSAAGGDGRPRRPPTCGGSIRGATRRRSPASSTAGSAERDLVALLWMLRQMLDRAGSIEGFFLEGYDPARADVGDGARQLLDARAGARPDGGVRPRCRSGRASATSFRGRRRAARCKRLNLFLRWMVRRDALDLGVWTRVSPAQADRAARHARDPRRPLPAADALHQPGLARWRATSPRRCARSIRTIRCSTTSRSATSG